MMKYFIIVFVAVVTVFVCVNKMSQNGAENIVCAYANEKDVVKNVAFTPVEKLSAQDTIFGPVSLPEVIVNVKRKVKHVM